MADNISQLEAYTVNMKKLHEDAQEHSNQLRAQALESANRARTEADQLHNVALQALQNAVESANMVSKQSIKHESLATDRQWNVDEVAQALVGNQPFMDAIMSSVVEAVTRNSD